MFMVYMMWISHAVVVVVNFVLATRTINHANFRQQHL